ncbi:hypothetical protein [Streptomyces sp. NPDC017964]|uniref:hypothetical protein n=1 Tax=Streptomyces sp. NPDC017964 TaxID=3365022 RepID=UPI0037891732
MQTDENDADAAPIPAQQGQLQGEADAPSPSSLRDRYEREATALDDELADLGVLDEIPARVRVALARRLQINDWDSFVIFALFIAPCYLITFSLIPLLGYFGAAHDQRENPYTFPEWAKHPDEFWLHLPLWAQIGTGVAALVYLGAMWVVGNIHNPIKELSTSSRGTRRGLSSLRRAYSTARKYSIVMECADVIQACATAHHSGGERRDGNIKLVGRRMRRVQRALPQAAKSRGTVPYLSHRHGMLRIHGQRASMYLQQVESKLDQNPNSALPEIASIMLQISSRYCEGRVGELIDPQQLEGIEVPRRFALARWLGSLATAACLVLAISYSGWVREDAQPLIYAIAVAVSLTIAFGANVRRNLEALGAIVGGP